MGLLLLLVKIGGKKLKTTTFGPLTTTWSYATVALLAARNLVACQLAKKEVMIVSNRKLHPMCTRPAYLWETGVAGTSALIDTIAVSAATIVSVVFGEQQDTGARGAPTSLLSGSCVGLTT
jgi:hypothetical protein